MVAQDLTPLCSAQAVMRSLIFVPGRDKIQLQEALYAATFVSAQEIVQHYGSIEGGAAVLNFGSGNVLTVTGIDDIGSLSDDVIL